MREAVGLRVYAVFARFFVCGRRRVLDKARIPCLLGVGIQLRLGDGRREEVLRPMLDAGVGVCAKLSR